MISMSPVFTQRRRASAVGALTLSLLAFSSSLAMAQTSTTPLQAANSPSSSSTAPVPSQPATAPSTTSQPAPLIGANGTPTPPTLLQDQLAALRPPPFGSELFSGAPVQSSTDIMNPNYIIKPGDHITLSAWGGLPDQTADLVVDPKGNIVVPGAGPVQVSGLAASNVNKAVNEAASQVFNNTVHLYATPSTTLPITVLVTGPVKNPGPYQGSSTDSVIAFLQRASGIDPNRGSYRDITVMRGGAPVAQIDLYAFLLSGAYSPLRLRDGDVIVVHQQGSVVSVYGEARAPFTFELSKPIVQGDEILHYARPRPETNYVGILGVRGGLPVNNYVPLNEFTRFQMADGDRVVFSADAKASTLVVQVKGAFQGPGAYVVSRQTNLGAVLSQIPVDPQADRRWIHLQRVSVALTQKQLLDEALSRLEKEIYTQTGSTESVVTADTAQALAFQQFIDRARTIVPQGDVALPAGTDLTQVTFEPDDTIIIPYKTQVVSIGGEVNEPQALIFKPGETAESYVKRAGGFSRLADRGKILVIHPDGSTQTGGQVGPGDRILVLIHLPGKTIELLKDLTQILYQIAIAGLAARDV